MCVCVPQSLTARQVVSAIICSPWPQPGLTKEMLSPEKAPSARDLKYCLVSPWPWGSSAKGTEARGRDRQLQNPELLCPPLTQD